MLISPPLETMTPNRRSAPIAVLASGSGTNFEAIVEAVNAGVINGRVVHLICNNPRAGVLDRAQRLGVASSVVDHREFQSRDAFDQAVVDVLRGQGAEWVVMAGWMRISTQTLVDAFQDRIINIHPSLLPSFRGNRAVDEAIAAGVSIAGCSVHIVQLEVDAGPIIAQAAVQRLPDDTVETLHQRIHEAEHALYPKAIAHAISISDDFAE